MTLQSYLIDAQLAPVENKLTATTDVTFIPQEDTRSVTFELNGSLKIDSITRVGGSAPTTATSAVKGKNAKPAATTAATPAGEVTFVQDQVGVSDLGPSVRIDLGGDVPKGTPVTLRFKYSGVLNTPQGGPLLNKRLAYVGDSQGYLMYAARWFPFHDYAADLATADITISVPDGLQIVGYSDSPAANAGGKFHFVQSKPGLVGNFAYGKYASKSLNFGDYELQFYAKPGNEQNIASYGETLGKALEFYTKKLRQPRHGQAADRRGDRRREPGLLLVARDAVHRRAGRSKRPATSRPSACSVKPRTSGGA